MPSSRIVDLRARKGPRRPPSGQRPLFSAPQKPRRQDRPLPLRSRRRRARAAAALALFLLVGAATWGVGYLSYLPRFTVQEIAVRGAEDLPPRLIRYYAETVLYDGSYHFLSRANVLLFPREEIEHSLASFFPRVKSARIERSSLLATAATVAIEEREPFALWCKPPLPDGTPDACYQMDNEGVVFAVAPESATSSARYIFGGGLVVGKEPVGQTFASSHLPGLSALLAELGQAGLHPLGATVENDQDFIVPFAEGFTLKASFGKEPSALTRDLQLVLSSDPLRGKEDQIEYADLRFGNKVYYKLKGEERAQSQ